jgi:inner membrane protein YidH
VSSASSATPRTPPDPDGPRERETGVEDATRRTRLANERTYLAWWRTGLTALAVAVGIGRLVPEVSDVTRWPYALVGAGFGVLGIVFIWLGFARARAVEAALDRGSFAPLGARITSRLLVAGLVLGVAVLLVVIFAR